jgi:hypothetical protein
MLALASIFIPIVGSESTLDESDGVPASITTSGYGDAPNLLFILDTSTSMETDFNGNNVGGGGVATSKSYIARKALIDTVTTYQNDIHVGLITYDGNDGTVRAGLGLGSANLGTLRSVLDVPGTPVTPTALPNAWPNTPLCGAMNEAHSYYNGLVPATCSPTSDGDDDYVVLTVDDLLVVDIFGAPIAISGLGLPPAMPQTAESKAAWLRTLGVKTFVVGLGITNSYDQIGLNTVA